MFIRPLLPGVTLDLLESYNLSLEDLDVSE